MKCRCCNRKVIKTSIWQKDNMYEYIHHHTDCYGVIKTTKNISEIKLSSLEKESLNKGNCILISRVG